MTILPIYGLTIVSCLFFWVDLIAFIFSRLREMAETTLKIKNTRKVVGCQYANV
jgi:hypothetical protein